MLPAPVSALPVGLLLTFQQLGGSAAERAATQGPVSQAIVAIILAGVFVMLALEAAHRVLVVFCAVAMLWGLTYLTPYHLISFEQAHQALDLNVLLLLASMMAVVGVLKTTGVFSWAVGILLQRAGARPRIIQSLLIWFTAVFSSVADNVTTVVFATPMAIAMAAGLGIPSRALLLPMIMAANIGGTATLIGDPPNILIGSAAHLSFLDFLINLTIPVVVMVVILDMFSARWFRRELNEASASALGMSPTIQNPLLLRWSLLISALIFVGFLTHGLTGMPAAVPAAIGAAMLLLVQDILYLRQHKPSPSERVHGMLEVLQKEIEWPTLSFFAFLFIAVGAAVQTGLIQTIADGLSSVIHYATTNYHLSSDGTLAFAAIVILVVSGVMSALVDNIPFVAVSIPIVATLVTELTGDTVVLWWALSLGACLGGNGSPVGASANVTVIGLSDRSGDHITFGSFVRFGLPVTALTLFLSAGFIVAHVHYGIQATLRGAGGVLVLVLLVRLLSRRTS